MNRKNEIHAYIRAHEREFVRDVARLCAVNSERMEPKEGMPFGEGPYNALMTFGEIAKEAGFAMKVYDNAVGSVDLSDAPRRLDMLAHLDVVPAGEGWSVTEPFTVLEKDGFLYGRGTADDKGPALAAFWALKCVRDLGFPLKNSARLVVGTDEECGSGDLPHYYAVEKEPAYTFSPDADYPVINLEKGSYKPTFGAEFTKSEELPRVISVDGGIKTNVLPGKARAKVLGLGLDEMKRIAETVTEKTGVTYELAEEANGIVAVTAVGQGAHAAMPETGNNAVTGLVEYLTELPLARVCTTRALQSLKKLFPHGDLYGQGLGVAQEDEISGKLTLVFSILHMDEDGFKGEFDSRCPVCANEENTKRAAERAFRKEAFEVSDSPMNPPHYVPAESPFVQELLRVYEEYTGQKGEPLAIGGGTYVHHLANGVAFGCVMPGSDPNMHGADEHAKLEELLISAEMFAQVIADLCE